MKYGKIRIEDGNLIFAKRMLINYLPCKDILWAYMRREGVEGGRQKQFSTSSLVIITRRKKRYEFEMTLKVLLYMSDRLPSITVLFCVDSVFSPLMLPVLAE